MEVSSETVGLIEDAINFARDRAVAVDIWLRDGDDRRATLLTVDSTMDGIEVRMSGDFGTASIMHVQCVEIGTYTIRICGCSGYIRLNVENDD